ncbi:hypothetical protein ACX0G9_16630 [Flavitalea flava]
MAVPGIFPVRIRITVKGISVECDSVKAPVAVRYGFKDWLPGDLCNTESLPVAPFRTDNWQVYYTFAFK